MGIITLTDRISISVRAKNETEKSAQNKATGANIQKALGGSGLSDTDLEEIGNVNSIADEQGNEWIKMEDIIAAGRKMKENGAFGEKTEYDEYTYNGYKIFHISALTGIVRNGNISIEGEIHRGDSTETWSGDMYISGKLTYNESTSKYTLAYSILADGNDIMYEGSFSGYDGSSYSSTSVAIRAGTIQEGGFHSSIMRYSPNFQEISPMLPFNERVSLSNTVLEAAVRNGGTHHGGGGSLIDWDAPNAEVERQIKELHETWDVTEHEGSVTANGTYVLAGPIEFNDGD